MSAGTSLLVSDSSSAGRSSIGDTATGGGSKGWGAGLTSAGEGGATRTDAPADVTLDVATLGAGYLGHPIGARLRAGLVAEHRAGAYAELARAMRTLVAPEPSSGF